MTTGAPSTARPPGSLVFDEPWRLRVVLLATETGETLGDEPVLDTDLVEAKAEAWFNGYPRRGHVWTPREAVSARLAPIFAADGRCRGYAVRTEGGGRSTVQTFGVESLAAVAERAAARLLDQAILNAGDTYLYELAADHGPPAGGDADLVGLRITTRFQPLLVDEQPLDDLLAGTRTVGERIEGVLPVLFTAAAHARMDHLARQGAADVPPRETGALLIGRLLCCPRRRELYVLVEEAIEVADAEQREFALIPTSRTWGHVETMLASLEAPRRLLGQGHGHNFAVEGEPCAACSTTTTCSRTTVFVSSADRTFMRSVFSGQPYALCWIAGTNARREPVATLYTARGGVLRARGYHVLAPESGGGIG